MNVALSESQKTWAIGGSIGVLAFAVGYGFARSSTAHAAPSRQLQGRPSEHHKRRKHPGARGDHDENDRGEYGRKHREHKHG